MSNRILFVEDDTNFRDTFLDVLRRDGHDVEGAASMEEARARLAADADWDLVVTDERLRGGDGPSTGAELAREVAVSLPHAKTIIITAYPTNSSVSAGFDAGAWDYLVKGDGFEPMLRKKVGNALELVRSARLARLAGGQLELELRRWWQSAKVETNSNRKGRALEQVLVCLFRSLPGLSEVQSNRRNNVEEIDLVVANESPDPFWQKLGAILLVECKNWSRSVGPAEVSRLADELRSRPAMSKLGFLVSMGGLSEGTKEKLRLVQAQGMWIVPLQSDDVEQLVLSETRATLLKTMVQRTAVT